MTDNFEGGELNPVEGVRRHYKKNFSVLSCLGRRARGGCDRGSEVEKVHSGQDCKGPVPIKPKQCGRTESCEISSPKKSSRCANLCNGRGQWLGNMGEEEFWRTSPPAHYREVQQSLHSTTIP